jgi:hypothetical protein
VLYGKPARDCTPDEIAREVWEQIKRAVNDSGEARLTDDMLVSWHLDPGLSVRGGRLHNDDPLVLPTAGTWDARPDPVTQIPNLMLCGDYLKSDWEVGNMDTASYNARRAVNAILDRTGAHQPHAMTVETYRPPEWEPLKAIDEQRYRQGQSNLFDTPRGMRVG